ncbi:1-acyl-sn-glycerol-3-phosphate acyltransferase [Actinoallomurus iriomotensis]|uniref:Acyltransferase n=1 Tax=Actinoallomurus iriomotensis TaxID=478107 RepID=A0A9W6VU12_9ACTN|nr:1-acyl-sn-glycerol-3-phosphate acyltransferase [Actinoallomurus iriomotensis]GLY79087.1 acyltransferase [Actinoallomurus iriomotensis]
MIPPRFVRRVALIPLLVVVTAVAVVVGAPLLLLGLVVSRGRRRVARVTVIAVSWLAMECVVLCAALALWPAGGDPETARERHYALCGWFLGRMYGVATRALGLVIEIQEPLNASSDRPVIVLSRHAGPGDSFLIVHFLLNVYGRRPRIVMKAALRLDPAVDVVLGRLPNVFVTGREEPGGRVAAEIGRQAAALAGRDALLIFPEGGNFTPRRRVRAIRSLRRRGRRAAAERARGMTNVLPPRGTGTLAALAAAPHADVVFVAHTGADDLLSPRDIWRNIPMEQPLRARWWRISHEEIPEEDRERWLYDWWETIDAWIAENRPEQG